MRSGTAQLVGAALALGTMSAMPFVSRGGAARRVLSAGVVGGLFTATTAASTRRWGLRRGLAAAGSTAVLAAIAEQVGTRTGFPFGRYRYTRTLRPQLGGVPVLVPIAWFAMAVPARETAHAVLGARSTRTARIVVGAATLTAWDLFIDPQMVGEGYWQWARRGAYRGIPLSNYVGWFATGLGVMALLEVVVPPGEAAVDLVAEYGMMAVMETVGFAAFFGDRLVAAVGGLGMLPIASFAVARLVGQHG